MLAATLADAMALPLLEPVASGQARYRMPGLATDNRGIAVGREVLVVLPTLDRLVAFLGAYSDEASLDDLVPTLTLERAERRGGGQAFLCRAAIHDGYGLDRMARLAAVARGQAYTGAGALFVPVRDRDAPFGWDLVEVPVTEIEEVATVDLEAVARFRAVDRFDPVDLIQRLQLQRVPLPLGGIARDPELGGLRDLALVLVPPGLAARVLDHLWRTEVAVAGHRVRLEDDRQSSLLLRLRHPPARALQILSGIPGVELLRPISPRVAVELGYAHPLNLSSASSCFPGEEMFLFRGHAGRVERLPSPPRFVDGRHLVETRMGGELVEIREVEQLALDPVQVELRLRPSSLPREPRASLVEWERVELLRRLVYLIPPSALAASRIVPLSEGLLVLTGSSLGARTGVGSLGLAGSIVPLGQRLSEVAPGVLVPDGYELWPRIRPQLVRQLLGLDPEDHAVFLGPHRPPLRVRQDQLQPLDVAFVGRLAADRPSLVEPDLPPLSTSSIRNERLGRFALWGFSREAASVAVAALPPGDETHEG